MLDVVFGSPADVWLFSWPIFHHFFLGRQPPLFSVLVTLVASTGFCHLQRLPMNQCQCCILSYHTCIHPCSIVGGGLWPWPQWQAHHRVDLWGCAHLPSCVTWPSQHRWHWHRSVNMDWTPAIKRTLLFCTLSCHVIPRILQRHLK